MKVSLRRLLLRSVAKLPAPFVGGERLRSLPRPTRLLIIRPDHIGDVLFTTPALRALRAAMPDAHISYLVGPWAEEVVNRNRNVDQVIICPFPGFTRRAKRHLLEPYVLLWRYARRLRRKHFDVAVILRFDHWWGAMLAHWTGIPRRIGYALPETSPFLTDVVPYVTRRHEVEQNMHLIAAALGTDAGDAGPLEFELRAEEANAALGYLAGKNAGQRYVCLHPGAGAAVKLWRPEAFARVADALADRYGFQVIISGSRVERGLAQEIAGRMRNHPIVVAGQTSLPQLAAIMGRCELVIGVDSGPLHLAVSQGTPTVHLFGPVDHHTFGPWGDPRRHVVLLSDRDCIPCNRLDYPEDELEQHPCVRSITVAQVMEAADHLLTNNSYAR